MRAQHTDGTVITVSYRNFYHQNMHRNGWRDVTPERSPKQVAQSKTFQALGTLSRTVKCLDICIAQAQFDEVDRARLRMAQDVLSTKITSIRRESIQLKNTT